MRLFELIVFFTSLYGSVWAKQTAVTCSTTADCAWGETCVAGDSETSVQSCVPPTVCGGQSMGNCPADDGGELACLWRPNDDCRDGCAILNGRRGIYKCVSIARCDAYYGGASCSNGCSVNGVQCNGQGSCNMMETMANGTPVLGCTCENGYRGEKCEVAPRSTPSSNSSSTDGLINNSGSVDDNTDNSSANLTDNSDNSTDQSAGAILDETPSDCSSGNCETMSRASPTGIRTGTLVTIITLSALALICVILVAMRLRRKKHQTDEEFADALAFTHGAEAVHVRDLNSSLSSSSL
ncbi:EGF-like, conserved site [Plasmopara halstedii]|uniref:EGF-like, conserved site n=1 Tax=Plasmopara halstedii TaxID=4781 RepID=A0A0N7L3A4_PLAHL|nr:EGF-like, conserved site [Plasmopara halstedii]CEG35323.1 EGF-like, conserved site [Plasmopara halstedii]|eukprot:XP_024571692.1 EGF-like, conserved site [Plasmopara halstedii]